MGILRIFHHGKIATNSTPYFAEAIGVEDGKISSVGGNFEVLRLKKPDTETIDLRGQTVIPGLNDSHLHIIRGGLHYSYVAMGHVFTANMTGNIVFLGFAPGGVPGLSIARSATALGFALVSGFLAEKSDSWLGKKRRKIWLATALAIEVVLLIGQ